MEEQNRSNKRLWLGLIFVIIGGIWLLDNLDIIPFIVPGYLISWQTFLILLGAFLIVGRQKVVPGGILIAVGALFLLDDLRWLDVGDVIQIFWPAIIIFIGVSLIMRQRSNRPTGEEKKNRIDYVDDFAIFGGREITIDSQDFKGGKVTAMFGGSSIDMRKADLPQGQHILDVFAVFGGTSLIVPPDWTIQMDVFSLFGGFSDKRVSAVKVVPNPNKVLVVKGFVMFGGGEVKLEK